jgi:hypothetical protein
LGRLHPDKKHRNKIIKMNQENGLLFMLIRDTSIVDGGQYSFSPLLCQYHENRHFRESGNPDSKE